jgi:hypothetical protein
LIVCRYERIKKASTTSSTIVMGITSAKAAIPTKGTRWVRICSVP